MLNITFPQIIAHIIGDYFLQNDYLATRKNKNSWVCLFHSLFYILPFVLFFSEKSYLVFFIIAFSHFIIDRFSLAKYLNRWKNLYRKSEACPYTGMGKDRIEGVNWFVYIVMDNTLHVVINAWALSLT